MASVGSLHEVAIAVATRCSETFPMSAASSFAAGFKTLRAATVESSEVAVAVYVALLAAPAVGYADAA